MFMYGRIIFFLLSLKNVSAALDAYKGLNVLCIAEHCASQALECLEDTDCKTNFECITNCGSNTTCIFVCLNTYENKVYNDVMQCMVLEHHCLTLDPPDPPFRCSPPTTFVKNFSLAQLRGTWYVVRGLNKDYDCFDCHISNYYPSTVPKNYTLLDGFDLAYINGSIGHRMFAQQIQQQDPSNGGLLDNTNSMMGLTSHEKWRVMYYAADANFMVIYWCGHVTSNWSYEGTFVLSRSPTLSPADLANVATVLMSTTGHTLDQFCSPNTINCKSSP